MQLYTYMKYITGTDFTQWKTTKIRDWHDAKFVVADGAVGCHNYNPCTNSDDKESPQSSVFSDQHSKSWWRHQMETFSALLAICAGNSPVSGEFPAQRPVTRSFDVFFDVRLIKRLSKHSRGWWFGTLSHPLWRHRNDWGRSTDTSTVITKIPQQEVLRLYSVITDTICFYFCTVKIC